MKYDFFEDKDIAYHVSHYFFRIEFQQRGAPHLHSLLWLQDKNMDDAPCFWSKDYINEDVQAKAARIEAFADLLTSTSADDIGCEKHSEVKADCNQCTILKDKVTKFQSHKHTATCNKKRKTMTIKQNKGHDILDGIVIDDEMKNIPIRRFTFPRFPNDRTRLIIGI